MVLSVLYCFYIFYWLHYYNNARADIVSHSCVFTNRQGGSSDKMAGKENRNVHERVSGPVLAILNSTCYDKMSYALQLQL